MNTLKNSNGTEYHNSFQNVILLLCLCFFPIGIVAQQNCIACTDNHIKSVMIYANQNELTHPVIELNTDDFVTLRFDELRQPARSFAYKLSVCDPVWNKVQVIESDFFEGFSPLYFSDFSHSFHSAIPYVHYHLKIPNDDIKILQSGNYCIEVFDADHETTPIFCRRFFVFENQTTIQAQVLRPRHAQFSHTHQEPVVEVDVSKMNDFFSSNPIKLVIYRNFETRPVIVYNQFNFIGSGKLRFDSNRKKLAKAYTDFLHLDAKDYKFKEMRTQRVALDDGIYHFYLITDHHTPYATYQYQPDINGNFLINDQHANHSHTEAQYVMAHFALQSLYLSPTDSIYVVGGFNNMLQLPQNLMTYNYENQTFELSMMLKAGYYDYSYRMATKHYLEQTAQLAENEYLILFYYFDNYLQNYKLLGKSIVFTQKE